MALPDSIRTLYAELATALGVDSLPAAADGSLQLSLGDTSTVYLFAESAEQLLLMSPVMVLPQNLDYGSMLWLLRRNFHDSPIAPFVVACDAAGGLVLWGRLPVARLSGEALAGVLDALGEEADLIREELEQDEDGGDDDEGTPPVAGA